LVLLALGDLVADGALVLALGALVLALGDLVADGALVLALGALVLALGALVLALGDLVEAENAPSSLVWTLPHWLPMKLVWWHLAPSWH
jgi:hypothetical protein